MRKLNKWVVSPEFHRIPHFNKDISNMTHDDICTESEIQFPIKCYVQEKIDGANMGVSWLNDGPVLRNRKHILNKGYSKIKTPAKKQFTSAWNWIHKHESDIKKAEKIWESPITIFGEYMWAKHSIEYNKLPDWFIAYDIWSVNDEKFLSPIMVDQILSQTSIKYIKPIETTLNSVQDIISLSEMESSYRDGIVEGIVIKTSNGDFLNQSWKVVNSKFERREDFNSCLIKNSLI